MKMSRIRQLVVERIESRRLMAADIAYTDSARPDSHDPTVPCETDVFGTPVCTIADMLANGPPTITANNGPHVERMPDFKEDDQIVITFSLEEPVHTIEDLYANESDDSSFAANAKNFRS